MLSMSTPHKFLPNTLENGTLIVTPIGDSLGVEERMLEKEIAALHKAIEKKKARHIVIDVSGSPYFGSLMMGAMIALCKRATDEGGKAALCCASGGMLESIQIMRLDRVVPHFPNREDALEFVQR